MISPKVNLRDSNDEELWLRKTTPELDEELCEAPVGSLSSEDGGLEWWPLGVAAEAPLCLTLSNVKLAIVRMEPGSLMLAWAVVVAVKVEGRGGGREKVRRLKVRAKKEGEKD